MSHHYVVPVIDDRASILSLAPKTLAEARQSISWQRQGGFEHPFHICTYDPEQMSFVCIETGEGFAPIQSGWTDLAWTTFMLEVDPRAAAAGGFSTPMGAPTP